MYPSGVTLYTDSEPTPVNNPARTYIEANCKPVTTTTVNHTYTSITEDISRNVTLYLYNSGTSSQKPVTESTA